MKTIIFFINKLFKIKCDKLFPVGKSVLYIIYFRLEMDFYNHKALSSHLQ